MRGFFSWLVAALLLVAALGAASFWWGRSWTLRRIEERVRVDTVVVERPVHDTVWRERVVIRRLPLAATEPTLNQAVEAAGSHAPALPGSTFSVDTLPAVPSAPDSAGRPDWVAAERPDSVARLAPDSIAVAVPIDRYIFRDSTYRIEVTGYDVQLLRAEFYPRTTVIAPPARCPGRWGVNLGVGVSLTAEGKITPALQLTVGFRICSF